LCCLLRKGRLARAHSTSASGAHRPLHRNLASPELRCTPNKGAAQAKKHTSNAAPANAGCLGKPSRGVQRITKTSVHAGISKRRAHRNLRNPRIFNFEGMGQIKRPPHTTYEYRRSHRRPPLHHPPPRVQKRRMGAGGPGESASQEHGGAGAATAAAAAC